jgi:hypothetical protein
MCLTKNDGNIMKFTSLTRYIIILSILERDLNNFIRIINIKLYDL